MRRVIRIDISEVLPVPEDVLRRLEVPRGTPISPAVRDVMDEAAERMARAAEPRGVLQALPAGDFAAMYRGDGRNADASPLESIAPQAEALAIFVGTIGRGVSEVIEALFRAGDPSLGMMIDAYASEAANRLAYVLAAEFLAETHRDGIASEATRVLPYSPGYCGWHVSGQRALFAMIRPEDIGVQLKKSFLMTPIKSVSGVMVAGGAAAHRFRPVYAFCDECTTRDCIERMASILR